MSVLKLFRNIYRQIIFTIIVIINDELLLEFNNYISALSIVP